jgi:translocation and assembly module TamB
MRSPREKLGRIARVLGKVLVGLLLLIVLLPVLTLAALRFEAVRSRVAAGVDSALSSSFRGRVRIDAIHWVDLTRVAARARVEDASGRTVVRADGLEARVFWPALVFGVLSGSEPLRIELDEVSLLHAELKLIDDGSGVPTIASAFDPRTPSNSPGGPAPRVSIGKITAKHVWVHGALAGAPPLDADVSSLELSLHFDERALELPVNHAELVARGLPNQLDPRGTLRGRLRIPTGAPHPDAEARYRGRVAGTELVASFALTGDRLEGKLDAPAVDQGTLARFAPDLELSEPARVTAGISGTLPKLAFTAEIVAAAGRVKARGSLLLEDTLRLSADLTAEDVNVARVVRDAPSTSLDFTARFDGRFAGSEIEANYAVNTEAGSVSGQALPKLATHGKLRSQADDLAVTGELDVFEPGARTSASYTLKLAGGRGRLELASSTDLAEPPRLRALAGVRTRGKLKSALGLSLPEQVADGRIELALENLAAPGASLGATGVNLGISGKIADPRFAAALDARDVRAQGRVFERARIRAEGTLERARITGRLYGRNPDELRFDTELALGERTELTKTELSLVDREGPLKVSVKRLSFAPGSVALEDVAVSGAGNALLSFEQRGTTLRASGRITDLDVGRLARLTGAKTPIKAARATLDLRYDSDRTGTSGFVVGWVEDVAYADVRGARADVDLRLLAERLTGTVTAAFAPGARVVLALDELVVPGPPFALPPPDRVFGKVTLRGNFDLHGMTPLLASFPEVPIGDARGRVSADIAYERGPESPPSLVAKVRTNGLDLSGRRTRKEPILTTDEAIAASTWHLEDVDVKLDLALDAAARKLVAKVVGFDEHGELVRVEAAASELPALASLSALASAWQDVPVSAKVYVPERRLRRLPEPVRPTATNGTVELSAELEGTAKSPRLSLSGKFGRLRAAGGRELGQRPTRVDVDFQGNYARTGGKVLVYARREQVPAAQLSGSWEGDILKFDPENDRDLFVRAEARLDKLNLDTISALKNRQIGGELSGDVLLEYGKGRRRLFVDARAAKLELGQVKLDSMSAGVVARDGELRGDVTVRGKAGSLDAAIRSGLSWQGKLAPQPQGDIDATLDARGFRLGALWPLTSASFSELDGRLDAELKARVRGGKLALSGRGKLAEGIVQIPALGQRFDRISARIDVMPEEIRLADVRAHGVSGALTANSVILLDERLALREVKGAVRIKESERIPVTLEGVTIGDAWGNIDARYVHKPDRNEVAIKFSGMHLLVPDVDQHSVQSLEPAEGIRIGVHQKDQKFVALPIQPLEQGTAGGKITPTTIDIDLGKDFWIKRGDLVNVQLTGKLQARAAEETTMVGRIQVVGGTLDVSGKRFEIERGTITFTGGDPANPTVTALARWDSPAGYTVYAEYAGTAENGHLQLRAEPQLTEDQIVTLLMFGTPDGSYAGDSSGGSEDTAAGAIGIAGGTAARGLNRALSGMTNLDVQARVDTSTGSARPEIVVGLSPRLSARVTRAIGEPPAGTSPDRTFLTLELRLQRSWVLSGLVGDRGASALDLIWRHRY